jgi:hypothetical protein
LGTCTRSIGKTPPGGKRYEDAQHRGASNCDQAEPQIQFADHQEHDSENQCDPEAHGSKQDRIVQTVLYSGGYALGTFLELLRRARMRGAVNAAPVMPTRNNVTNETKEAGVAPPTVYAVFGSKRGILQGLMERAAFSSEYENLVREAVKSDDPAPLRRQNRSTHPRLTAKRIGSPAGSQRRRPRFYPRERTHSI